MRRLFQSFGQNMVSKARGFKMGAFDHLIPKDGLNQGGDSVSQNSFDHLIPDDSKRSSVGNLGLGLARGVRDLIDGPAYLVPKGIEKLADAAGFNSVRDWAASEAHKVSDINKSAEKQYQDLTPDSAMAGAGRVGANVLSAFIPGTGQVKAANAIERLLASGQKAKAVAAMSGIGAAQNVLLNTKTEDDDLIKNAVIGGALAPVGAGIASGASRAIQGARNSLAGSDGRVGKVLATASGESPDDLMHAIAFGNKSLVPGSNPSTSHAAMNPGISQLDRTLRNQGFSKLSEADSIRNMARISAVDKIAPGATQITSAEAAHNAGSAIRADADGIRDGLQKEIRALYENPDLESATLKLPDGESIDSVIDRFYPGMARNESPPDLRRIAELLKSADGPIAFKEFDALRKVIGNRSDDLYATDKTAASALNSIKSLLDESQASAISDTERKLAETGRGQFGPIYGNLSGDPENAIAHLLRTRAGEVPDAALHPQAGSIDLIAGDKNYGLIHIADKGRDDALRALPDLMNNGDWYSRTSNKTGTYIGNGTDEAAMRMDWNGDAKQWIPTAYEQYPHLRINPGTDRFSHLSGFTDDSKLPSSNRINNEILAQNFAKERNPYDYVGLMTPSQAETLATARKLFGEKVDRFETGRSSDMYRYGSDGAPIRDGAEIAKGFFHSGPSQSEDIDQLLKMLPSNSSGLDALKMYALSDLSEKSINANGDLSSSKLGSWLDRHSPSIRKLFPDEQASALGSVRDDLDRQYRSSVLGIAPGSNTAQNLIGGNILDSKIVSLLSRLLPYAGPAGLDAVRAHSKSAAVKEVGEAMVDPSIAMRALDAYTKLIKPNLLQQSMTYGSSSTVPALSSYGN